MNWNDIDPETRDLSTPGLWDAWREKVVRNLSGGILLYVGEYETASLVDVSWTYVAININHEDGSCQSIHVDRPSVPSLEAKLDDALARIEKLEAAEQARADAVREDFDRKIARHVDHGGT